MRDLDLVGLSGDGKHVLFRDDGDEDLRIRVDDRLRAALRGDRVRLGQVENNMDSALRPRDIQARIRAGESPEAVAAVAQVSLERIMGYALPVLAEREHVCRQARQSGLRRKHASGPGRLLGTAVDEHLRSNGWDPEAASWDSWRREDGRWSVTVAASSSGTPATFLFDAPGRYAFAHDDAARRLVGDEPPLSVEPETDEPRSGLPPVGPPETGGGRVMPLRRAEPVDDDHAGSADDTTDLTALSADLAALEAEAAAASADETPQQPSPTGAEPRARVSGLDRLRRQRAQADQPLPFDDDVEVGSPGVDPEGRQSEAAAARAEVDDDVEAIARVMSAPAQDRPMAVGEQRRRKPSRRAVPSWDEIMFGSKPSG